MFDRRRGQRRTSQIGMKNYSAGVDDLLQRESKPAFKLELYGVRNTFDGELCAAFIEGAARDFSPQAIEHSADRVGYAGAALTLQCGFETR